jgi:hypothetical protein
MGLRRSTFLVCLLVGAAIGAAAHAQSEWRISGAERVVAVADVHGAHEAFERILARAELIDASDAWIGGATHLVVVGDVLDRGPASRESLDLLMRLEAEAAAAGGRVLFVLGNHEVMNLTGDLRYVSPAEYAAFAPDESAELRQAAFERYRTSPSAPDDAAAARGAFDEAYPPGFFAHRRAFSPAGTYGGWLLDKPLMLVVDDVAFVHGGLGAAVIEHGSETNAMLERQLADYVAALDRLTAAGVLAPTDAFDEHVALLETYGARVGAGEIAWPNGAESEAKRLIELQSAALFSPDSAVWYRGNVSCSRLTEQDRLETALDGIGARRLVVGHTPTPGALVLSRMDEALLRIDTGMLRDYYGGRASALIIAPGVLEVIYEDEPGIALPVPQPRRVGIRPAGLTVETLEALLARAEVEDIREFDATARLVTLIDGDLEFEGLFTPDERDDVVPAVAAYRLDRLLRLDLVPVTVAREVGGAAGALQYWPPQSINERERSEQGLGASAWCPLGDQVRDMTVFDVLIFNEARTADRIRYSTDSLQLLLVGHDRTLSTSRGRPAYLAETSVVLTPAWRAALEALDEASLTEALGDVLDRPRIRALLERRDELLDSAL